MAELRQYPRGAPFGGIVGRTVTDSVPAWPAPSTAREGAPNVLLIVLDDIGFAQLGCFGADVETPTFDRLAANGLRYRDFHTTALCTPSRACLLTGRNHHANGVGVISEMGTGFPGYNGTILKENGFLSEMLLPHGYATFAVGKWHLTPAAEYAAAATRARWPLGRGFERYFGFLAGMTNHWVPDLADRAIEFVKDVKMVAPDKPFFLYYCLGAGHAEQAGLGPPQERTGRRVQHVRPHRARERLA